MLPERLRETGVHQVPDLDAFVTHLHQHGVSALVGVGWLGELGHGWIRVRRVTIK